MPYNVQPSTPPALSSSGNWMSIAQIIAGLVGGGGSSGAGAATATQSDALASGQGPLNAASANAWSGGLDSQLANLGGNAMTGSAATPGYNTNQFGVPLGAQKSNSY